MKGVTSNLIYESQIYEIILQRLTHWTDIPGLSQIMAREYMGMYLAGSEWYLRDGLAGL